ncbi:hypothetical protein QF027_000848 [Streptomyces canus]|nr:hypothetical protein [Streptomyces canus]
MASAQPPPVGTREKGDRGLREYGREVGPPRHRLPVHDGFGVVGPLQHGDGRGAGGCRVEAGDGFGDGQQAGRVGGAGLTGTHGAGEEGSDGGPQVADRREGPLVGDEGRGVRQRLGMLPDPGGETREVGQVVGDATMSVVPDGEGQVQGETGIPVDRVLHTANDRFRRIH